MAPDPPPHLEHHRVTTPLPPKQFTQVNGRRLAHLESGQGEPIVLLHGNPTSSYLWRDVMPQLAGLGRVIAPDLIGHGDSDKLPASDGPGRYTLEGTYELLAAQLAALGADQRVTLVLHDWGSALGFHWARLHPKQVRGIAYMEAIVMPLPSWDDWPEKARGIFQGFRSAKGEDLVLKRNLFIEGVLPSSILRKLSDEEMAAYRAPFAQEEDRQPMLNWPRQIPIAGEPPNVVALVQQYAQWLSTSPVPKLFVNAEPGSILVGTQREFCRSWPNQQEVTVPGVHFIQEDAGVAIGQAVAAWLSRLD
jgi:haloalkane dehalogenase